MHSGIEFVFIISSFNCSPIVNKTETHKSLFKMKHYFDVILDDVFLCYYDNAIEEDIVWQ